MIECVDTNSLVSDISNCFLSEEFTDVTVRVCDKEIRAHKFVLAARSRPFRAMLYGRMVEASTGIVSVSRFSNSDRLF
jgi:hypothetical protein